MACIKCNYSEKKEKIVQGKRFCSVCSKFAPINLEELEKYSDEKIDWKILDPFRKYTSQRETKQKEGMSKIASAGSLVTRAPLGYSVINRHLIANEDSAKVHSLFHTFLVRNYSLSSLAKNFSLSVNGIKKILSNRTYLGEIKFNGKIHKGNHKPIISAEIFYAVQRKLKNYLRPRKISS